VFKPTVKSTEEIYTLCQEANTAKNCIGIITWMHTFSPAKMWINGLKILQKPMLHLHTQYNRDIPWSTIDMDFMNLNQSAHGDREFGFMMSRMRMRRKVVVGHWQNADVHERINVWSRAAAGWHDWQGAVSLARQAIDAVFDKGRLAWGSSLPRTEHSISRASTPFSMMSLRSN